MKNKNDESTSDEKDLLIRRLITKICEVKETVDIRFDKEFLGNHAMLIKKINNRRKDIPSIEYLQDTYKFKPEYTDYTLTDLVESINLLFCTHKTNIILKEFLTGRKNNTDLGDSIESLDWVDKQLRKVRGCISKSSSVDVANETDKVEDEYRKLIESITFIPTGIKEVDEHCKPSCGSLLMLVGATGSGKSLLMSLMQKTANEEGIPSIYVSLEMSLVEVLSRLMVFKKICTFDELNSGKITPEKYREFAEQLKKTETHILTRTTESKINLATIERYIQEIKPKVVFLDYMTLLQDADFSWNAESPISAELKRLALQYNVLIVTALQADTASLTSGDVPDLHNVRGNKGFSYDANIVIGFASERKILDPDTFRFRFSIRKNRNGPIIDFLYEINPVNGFVLNITNQINNGF